MSAAASEAPLDSRRSRVLFGVCITFTILATLAVVARFSSRKLKKVPWETDDWLSLLGLVRDETTLGRGFNIISFSITRK